VGNAPFGKAIGLRRQRVEVGPIELFEQRPVGDTEAPQAVTQAIGGFLDGLGYCAGSSCHCAGLLAT
jgi:hypothetical protein